MKRHGWALAAMAVAMTAMAAAMELEYPSVPKGVVLEGEAMGMEPVQTVSYDRARHAFIINGNAIYRCPIDRDQAAELALALTRNGWAGVGLRPDRSVIVYGNLPPRSRTVRDLEAADRILGGTVLADSKLIGNTRLPGNYRPQGGGSNQAFIPAVTFHFKEYRFQRTSAGEYVRADFMLDPVLRAVDRSQRASDGGYIAVEGTPGPSYQANRNHIMANKSGYLEIPAVGQTARVGELASFFRWVRGGSPLQRGPGGGAYTTGGRPDVLEKLAAEMK